MKMWHALLLQIMQLKKISAFISAASTLGIYKTEVLTNLSIVLQPSSTQTATMTWKLAPQKPAFIVLSYFLKAMILKDEWVECLLLLLSWFQPWSQCFFFSFIAWDASALVGNLVSAKRKFTSIQFSYP